MVHQLKFSVNVFRRQILISISVVEKQIQSPALVGEAEIKPDEAMIFRPACTAFERIWVNKGKLNQIVNSRNFGIIFSMIAVQIPLAVCI